MARRVFCEKHMMMTNAQQEWDDKTGKSYGDYIGRCGCRFKESELSDVEVRITFYTHKHGFLENKNKPVNWKIIGRRFPK